MSILPTLHYSFNSWTNGWTTITNKGSLGATSAYNAMLCTQGTGGSATVTSLAYIQLHSVSVWLVITTLVVDT